MSSETERTVSTRKGDDRRKLLIGIVIAIIVVLIGAVSVLAYISLNKKSKDVDETEVVEDVQNKAVVTPESAEEIASDIFNEPVNMNIPQSYTVTQNATWTFPSGTEASTDAYVANDAENETAIYFDLIVNSTGEVVYSSPILELGASLEGFTLDKSMSAGSYDCTVEYHLIDENRNTLTTVNFGVDVNILR